MGISTYRVYLQDLGPWGWRKIAPPGAAKSPCFPGLRGLKVLQGFPQQYREFLQECQGAMGISIMKDFIEEGPLRGLAFSWCRFEGFNMFYVRDNL